MIKKIVIICNASGGLYGFRKELISELVNRGIEIVALTPFTTRVDLLRDLGVKLIEIKMDKRGTNPVKDFDLIREYVAFIRQLSPDYIITYTIKPNIYGGIVSRLLRIPYSCNITGLGTAFENSGLLRIIVKKMYKISLRHAKNVFFENSANRDLFLKNKIISSNQAVLLNGAGVNLDHFSLLPYPSEEKPFHFLFIGRVMQEKGVNELFDAMKRLLDEGYDCCLDMLGGLEEDYKQKIEQNRNEGWLNYYGFQEDVRPFIKKCHCFVLPSWHEGMANTNLEAAATGRPVITSNTPGCKEAVIEGETGYLCETKDTNSLYKEMRKMCHLSMKEREKMGKSGRKHMEDMFDKKKVVTETIEYIFK